MRKLLEKLNEDMRTTLGIAEYGQSRYTAMVWDSETDTLYVENAFDKRRLPYPIPDNPFFKVRVAK